MQTFFSSQEFLDEYLPYLEERWPEDPDLVIEPPKTMPDIVIRCYQGEEVIWETSASYYYRGPDRERARRYEIDLYQTW